MTISTYAELQTAVINRLHRANLAALVPDFIALGEARIYRDLRIRAMETALAGTIAAGVLALPTGYIELKSAYIDGSPARKLTRKTLDFIYTNYPTRSSSSCPVYMAREGDNFVFGPYPDTSYAVKGIYYKRLPALSDSNTTNWLITNAPDILLYAALVEAADHTGNDAALMKWEAKYLQVKDRIQRESDGEEFSGSTLSMSAA